MNELISEKRISYKIVTRDTAELWGILTPLELILYCILNII